MRRSGKFLLFLGCAAVFISLALILFLQVQTRQAERTNKEIVQIMESILIDRREGTIDPGQEAEMPALEIQNDDFVALLEIPSYGLKLPVADTWNRKKVMSHPCRFSGSVYHGTLVIGGFDQAGQFDFFERISNEETILVTDMAGYEYAFVVHSVERSSSAEAEILHDEEADLTIFVRDAQLLEYIILRCVVK